MDTKTLRKLSSIESGKRYFEEGHDVDPLAAVDFDKVANAQDPELLEIAAHLPGDTLSNYEALGGKYGRRVE
jgi:hypothetical protein